MDAAVLKYPCSALLALDASSKSATMLVARVAVQIVVLLSSIALGIYLTADFEDASRVNLIASVKRYVAGLVGSTNLSSSAR